MRYKALILFLISSILVSTQLSGCLDALDPFLNTTTVTYEARATSVNYDIVYGYMVNASGTGSSTVLCIQDIPELLQGSVTKINKTPLGGQLKIIATNEMTEWNDTNQDDISVSYEVSAHIEASDFFIRDISGSTALDLEEIKNIHPDLIETYCGIQGNNETIYIDPFDLEIKQIADSIKQNSDSENSLLLAKALFIWLKANTNYKIHPLQKEAQPAIQTLNQKQGDCDDLSFLYISLCRSLDIPARFIRGYLLDNQGELVTAIDHMWVEVFVGGILGNDGWIPIECAGTGDSEGEVHQNFGMEDAFHLRLFTGDGTNESIAISSSHISVQYEQGVTIDITGFCSINNFSTQDPQKLCITEGTERSYC